MIQSMTGYGKTSAVYLDKKLNVEIRALNGKTSDVRVKYPSKYASKELWIRKYLLNNLHRGKFDVTISIDGDVSEDYGLDEQLFKTYYHKLFNLAKELGIRDQDYFSTIVRIPNVVRTMVEELVVEEWQVCEKLIEETVAKLNNYRIAEGKALKEDIGSHNNGIMVTLGKISHYEAARIKAIKDKITTNLNGFIDKDKIDENRFEQELLYYLERLDINEEKIRLEQNCKYFKQVLNDDSILVKGKKLIFISQEIGREINTMGAKAQYAPIQQLVVNMKDDLERIKEQLLNVL